MRNVTPQELSDHGLNPFAVVLLVESWKRHPNPVKVTFAYDGVMITLEAAPPEAPEQDKTTRSDLASPGACR